MPFHSEYKFITTLSIATARPVYKPKMCHRLTFSFDPAGLVSIRVFFWKTEMTKAIFSCSLDQLPWEWIEIWSCLTLCVCVCVCVGFKDLMKANGILSPLPCESLPLALLSIQTHGIIDNICELLNKMKEKTSSFNFIISLCFSYKKTITFMKVFKNKLTSKCSQLWGKNKRITLPPAAKS